MPTVYIPAPIAIPTPDVVQIPFNELATRAGNERAMNMLVAGAYAAITGYITLENLCDAIDHTFVDSKAKYAEGNRKMAELGYKYAKEHFPE